MLLTQEETQLSGVPICIGVGVGRAFLFSRQEGEIPDYSIDEGAIEEEISRFHHAMNQVKIDLNHLKERLNDENLKEGAAILEAQLAMMIDPILLDRVETLIHKQRKNCESVLQYILDEYRNQFEVLSDPFFRERFKDLQDVLKRVQSILQGSIISLNKVPRGVVVFAKELTASDIAEADSESITGFVCLSGSSTSHAAIVAKAKGIPFVGGIDPLYWLHLRNETVIVDGRKGRIIINPNVETLNKFTHLKNLLQIQWGKYQTAKLLEPETFDGYSIRLSANLEMVNELNAIHQYGGNGIGLFRSEYVFLSNENFPSEDEQYQIYCNIIQQMQGLPIVIRTFDIGGDKFRSKHTFPLEENPFLGCRAIRFLLKEKEIFKTQLKAILRAAQHGDVSIMFPMVSAICELRDAKQMLQEAENELILNEKIQPKPIRIGCMIEVPSAAIISDLLASECDFLSIGTNDLVQYSLAVDRSNQALSDLYSPTHLSVIRLIKLIVSEANHKGIPVTVCGEIAADPRFTPLLLGLGVHELSVAARYMPLIKNAIRNTSIVEATKLAEMALNLHSSKEIQALLDTSYRNLYPEDNIYSGHD